METIVYCDSSFKKRMGCSTAVVIKAEEENSHEFTKFIGWDSCRNSGGIQTGELSAILLALKKLVELNFIDHNICIYSDSLNSVTRINANKPLHGLDEIYSLIAGFKNIRIAWLSKDKTREAHRLCYGITKEKTLERKLMRINVKHKKDNMFLVQCNGNAKIYEVDISKRSCTCIRYLNVKGCKHVKAAVYKAEKVMSGEIVDHFLEE